jgi:molecular chaperone GrpE (heat shock protein)
MFGVFTKKELQVDKLRQAIASDVEAICSTAMASLSASLAERLSLLNTSWNERLSLLNSSLGERLGLINAALERQLSETSVTLESHLTSTNASLGNRMDTTGAVLEKQISLVNTSVEERLSALRTSLDERLSSMIATIVSLDDRLNERLSATSASLAESASSLEQPLTLMGASLEDRLSLLSASVEDHLGELEEQMQQSLRQERRRQMALESMLETQNKTLEILDRPEMSPPLEALMALAENFILAHMAEPDTPTSEVLRGKLSDLMACFDLSAIAETEVAFDPAIHEACGANCDPSRPENSVLTIVRPGFFLRDKVLRCATVVVNRCPTESTLTENTEESNL